jgi:ABC-type oligopeptide transport system substrate-binding subunit
LLIAFWARGAAIDRARKNGHFDYDAEMEGLRARDRYTIELRLVEPDYTLLPYLAGLALSPVAREVVEGYGDAGGRVMEHPVGTGPYRLIEWRRGQRIVLAAHPGYHEEYFPEPPPGADAVSVALAKSMAGKRLPQIGRIELSIIEPPQPQLLAFASGTLDILDLPFELAPNVIDASGRLLPAYAGQGIDVQQVTDLYVGYLYFNMDDAVVGGDAPERLACGAPCSWPTTSPRKSRWCATARDDRRRSRYRPCRRTRSRAGRSPPLRSGCGPGPARQVRISRSQRRTGGANDPMGVR